MEAQLQLVTATETPTRGGHMLQPRQHLATLLSLLLVFALCSPIVAATFRDDFDGPTLDASKWSIQPGGGTIQLINGKARLAAGCYEVFPYVVTLSDPFPESGDFRIRVGFRYVDVQTGGNGFGAAYDHRPYGVWQGTGTGLTAGVGLIGELKITTEADTSYHVYQWDYVDGVYSLTVDGILRASSATSVRPNSFFFGHPPYGFCPWTTQEIDFVEIASLPRLPDIRVQAPPGWTSALVLRSDTTATAGQCLDPEHLFGDSAATYVNWSAEASPAESLPPWNYGLLLDGVRHKSYGSSEATGSAPSGVACDIGNEGGVLTLTAPQNFVFTSVGFASYGLPDGSCESGFTVGACNATTSVAQVQALCLGKSSCSIPANNQVFGDPCGGITKRLAVLLNYAGDYGLTCVNRGPLVVAGGWHTLTGVLDADTAIIERFEDNNTVTRQLLWQPKSVKRSTPIIRPAPPHVGALARKNCDAVRIDRDPRYAWVCAVGGLSTGDDYDVVLYDDYVDATNGLTHVIGQSATGGAETEFIVGTFTGTPLTVFPAIERAEAMASGPFVFDYADSRGHTSETDVAQWRDIALAPGRIADIYEVYFTVGVPRKLTLSRTKGVSDLALEIRSVPTPGAYGRGAGGSVGCVGSGAAIDTLTFVASQTGWHPIVVYRASHDVSDTVRYSFYVTENGILNADDSGHRHELELSTPFPNPATGGISMTVSLPHAGEGQVAVFDLVGRRIRTLAAGMLVEGNNRLVWDGRDGTGRRMAPGVYVVRAEIGAWAKSHTVVLR